MGTVGISFGSPTSGNGFDVSSTVSQIVANLQAVETPWKTKLSSLESQDTVLSTLGTDLSTLATDLENLTDFQGVLAGKEGSSSNTDVLALTSASTTASAGTHSVLVTQLAQTSAAASDVVANASDTLSGSITVQVGTGTAQTIDIDSSNPTLAGLAAAINAAGIGVTASIISDTSGSRLSLVSGTSGETGQLTVTSSLTDTSNSDASVGLSTIVDGQNAELTVDGISITSASNTITTAISGVTFQLLSKSDTAVQVVITNDTSSVESAISTFVSDYNTLMKAVNAQEGNDSSGNAEPLYGSTVLAQIQEQLLSAITGQEGSGSVTSLYQLGITPNTDGTLSLNTDTLDSILNSNYTDVISFFQDTGSFGADFTDTLGNLGNDHTYGAIYLALKENSSQESDLNDSISNEDALISTKESLLTTELTQANEILQEIPSQIQYVDEIYSAITGYNAKS